MTVETVEATVENKSSEFGRDQFVANAIAYAEHKRVIDAIATGIAKSTGGYSDLEDAFDQIRKVWDRLRSQVANGAGYTPDVAMGFGSNNASQVASALTGDRTSVGEIRKAFSSLGK